MSTAHGRAAYFTIVEHAVSYNVKAYPKPRGRLARFAGGQANAVSAAGMLS